MLMLDIGSKPNDRKLQILRTMSGISSDESNVLAVGSGEEGKLIYYHYRDYMGAIASGFSDRRHGDLPLFQRHAERHRPRHQRQPDPPHGRGPLTRSAAS